MKIIETNGKLRKVSDQEAYKLVDIEKRGKYMPKNKWKELQGKKEENVKKIEEGVAITPIAMSAPTEQKPKKEKKAKKEKK